MKNLRILSIACLFTVLPVMLFAQKKKSTAATVSPSNEIEMVKAAIDKESKAFFEINYSVWADCWAHVNYAYWSFADTTDVNFFEGWDSINKGFSDYFKTQKPSTAKMERNWHDIKVYGNSAYARFTQKIQDDLGRDEQAEVRVLEKINGQWKIIHVGVIAKQKSGG